MNTTKLMAQCPFREGTASRKIFAALAKSKKPLDLKEAASRAKVPLAKARTLVLAYMNPFHNAPLRRAGVAVVQTGEGYKLVGCKADPKARRPERGKSIKKKPAKRSAPKRTAKKKAIATATQAATEATATDAPLAAAAPVVAP